MDLEKIEQGTKLVLEGLGEDLSREGLIDTPKRVAKAYKELCSGYNTDIEEILSKTFKEDCDEMVIVKDIELDSLCEHHMLRFFGKAHVAYIPKGKVLGLSKISRLVDAYSKRLQIQERLTSQIADTLMTHLNPLGVGVIIEAEHTCMSVRGVKKKGSTTITSAMRGVFLEDEKPRNEFLKLIGK